jgi:translocator protein
MASAKDLGRHVEQYGLQGRPLTLFLAQLALNWAWSFFFFTLQSPGLALVNILALWVCIALTCQLFAGVDNAAARWLAPYLMWVFAPMLNVAIVAMN